MGEGGRGACLRRYDNIYLSKTVFLILYSTGSRDKCNFEYSVAFVQCFRRFPFLQPCEVQSSPVKRRAWKR